MTISLKKTYIAVLGVLLTATAHVQGYYYGSASEYDANTYGDCCDYNQDRCCDQVALPGWFIEAEYLYFRSSLCGLEPVFGETTIDIGTALPPTTVITERHREPHWEWDSGYRVGIGYSFGGCDNYDIQLYWTHINGRAHHRRSGDRGHWKLEYDVVDLTFGQRYQMCKFMVRPFVGVRFARIHQKLRSDLETTVTEGTLTSTLFEEIRQREHFDAVAPEVGVNTLWNFCGCWSVYGDFAFAPYYGHVHARSERTSTLPVAVTVRNLRAKRCFNSVATDSAFGIKWDTVFSGCGCSNMTFGLKLGIEAHRIYDFSDLGSDGTLTMVGGTVSAVLGF
jgi:hypothetical protein